MAHVTDQHLVVWFYEDSIKNIYFEFIQLLEFRPAHEHHLQPPTSPTSQLQSTPSPSSSQSNLPAPPSPTVSTAPSTPRSSTLASPRPQNTLNISTFSTRVAAFVKRRVQFCAGLATEVAIVCACLFMTGQLLKERAEVRALVKIGEAGADEEVTYIDADKVDESAKGERDDEDGDEEEEGVMMMKQRHTLTLTIAGNAILCTRTQINPVFGNCTLPPHNLSVRPHHPLQLTHPFSRNGSYDPLQNHTLMRFLERLVYKKPKRVASAYKGASLMQAKLDGGSAAEDGLLVGGRRRRGVVVATSMKKVGDISVDEMFFYQYFRERNAKKPLSRKKRGNGEGGDLDGDGGSDFDEDEVWKAMWKRTGVKVDEPDKEDEDDTLDDELVKGMADDDDDEDIVDDPDGWDEDGDMDEEDMDEGGDMDIGMMGSEEGSNDDMELMIQASDEESEKKEKKEDASKRGSKLAERATKLGYKGDFEMMFADASEFEKLMEPRRSTWFI
ncbi:hypothetical protein BJ742DRAFT_849605 [Cladochytrium replicatum]|nr:hypothetical protein BJ742DRAFT_849605 [Cladochytrium replicatum]